MQLSLLLWLLWQLLWQLWCNPLLLVPFTALLFIHRQQPLPMADNGDYSPPQTPQIISEDEIHQPFHRPRLRIQLRAGSTHSRTVSNGDPVAVSTPRVDINGVTSLAGLRKFNGHDGTHYYETSNRARVEARICAGILGPGPLTFEMMITRKWARGAYSLARRGVSRAGFAQYLATAAVGAITDPLVPALNQATAPAWKIEQIPNILRDKQALAFKLPALQEYAKRWNRADLFVPENLERIKQELEADKVRYFAAEDVEVVIVVKYVMNPEFSANVREAFHRLPAVCKSVRGRVETKATEFRPWEINIDGYVGAARTKKEARMIAAVRRYADPLFDGSSALRGDVVPRSPGDRLDGSRSLSEAMSRLLT